MLIWDKYYIKQKNMKSPSSPSESAPSATQPLPYGVSASALEPIRVSSGPVTDVGPRISDIGLANPGFDPTQPLRAVTTSVPPEQTRGAQAGGAKKPNQLKQSAKPGEISRRALLVGLGVVAAGVAVDRLTGGIISKQLPKLPSEFGGKNETAKTFEQMRELAAEIHDFSEWFLSDELPTYARLPDDNEEFNPDADPNFAIVRQLTRADGQEVTANLEFREGKFSPESNLCLTLATYSPKGERFDGMARSEVTIEYVLEDHFAGRFRFKDFMKIMADPDQPSSGIKIGSINAFTVDAKGLTSAWNIFLAGSDSLSVFHESLGEDKQTSDIKNWKTPNVAGFNSDAQQAFGYIRKCFEDVQQTAHR